MMPWTIPSTTHGTRSRAQRSWVQWLTRGPWIIVTGVTHESTNDPQHRTMFSLVILLSCWDYIELELWFSLFSLFLLFEVGSLLWNFFDARSSALPGMVEISIHCRDMPNCYQPMLGASIMISWVCAGWLDASLVGLPVIHLLNQQNQQWTAICLVTHTYTCSGCWFDIKHASHQPVWNLMSILHIPTYGAISIVDNG